MDMGGYKGHCCRQRCFLKAHPNIKFDQTDGSKIHSMIPDINVEKTKIALKEVPSQNNEKDIYDERKMSKLP
jgi:hypothetical protein